MKRKLLLIVVSCSLLFILSACGNKDMDNKNGENIEDIENKDDKEDYDYGELPGGMDESISVEYRNQISLKLDGKIENFKTKDLAGKNIDKSIFKDSEITILNVWGSEENQNDLKELQSLYNEVKDQKINVLGVLSNGDEDEVKQARKRVKSNGVEFNNIIADESLKENLLNQVKTIPTTLFINAEGDIVGDVILGPVSIENYKKALEVAKKHNKSK